MQEEEEPEYTDNLELVPEPVKKRRNIRKVGKSSRMVKITFKVLLPDNAKIFIDVADDFTMLEVRDVIADKLDMYQYELWSVCRKDKKDYDWIDPTLTVYKTGLKDKETIYFRVKYYKTFLRFVDPIAIHLFYHQLRQEVSDGKYHISKRVLLQLAALHMQSVYGQFNRGQHKQGFLSLKDMESFLPRKYIESYEDNLNYLEQKIYLKYRKLKQRESHEAKVKYIETMNKNIHEWGVQYFEDESEGDIRWIGIAESGLYMKDDKDPLNIKFVDFIEADFDYQDEKFTLYLDKGDTVVSYNISYLKAKSLVSLLNGYLYILIKQKQEGLEDKSVHEKPIDCPPYWKLQRPLKKSLKEKEEQVDTSLKELRNQYIELCKKHEENEISRFVLQIEEKLDTQEPLSELDLRRCNLSDASLKTILQSIESTFQIVQDNNALLRPKKLLLSMNELTSGKTIGKLCLMLDIESLDVSSNDLDQKAASDLASYIKECSNLSSLILDDNHILAKGAVKIIKALKKLPSLEEISFNNCGIRNDDVEDFDPFTNLMGSLLYESKSINAFSLQDNVLTDIGADSIISKIETTKRFQKVNLGNIFVNGDSGIKIASWLKKITCSKNNLHNLNLSYNVFPSSSYDLLGSMVSSKLFVIRELDLGYMKLPRDLLISIFNSAETNETLRTLILSGNIINKKVFPSVFQCITKNGFIKKLGLRNCQIEGSLSRDIAIALSNNKEIEDFDFAGNDIESIKAAEAWGKMLMVNSSLKRLNLAACQLKKEGIGYITSGLGRNEGLEILHLDGNEFSSKVVHQCASSLLKNSNLKILSIQDVNINVKDLDMFLKDLKDQKTLETIDLRRNLTLRKHIGLVEEMKKNAHISVIL